MALPFTKLKEQWGATPVFVIGGGPSLINFDFNVLRGLGTTVGANRAAFEADADVLVSLDQKFVKTYRSAITEFIAKGRRAILAMPTNEDGHHPIRGATYLVKIRGSGLSRDPTRIAGVHSGMAAIGVSYLAGAKDIRLLGIDMKYAANGNSHFHSGYAGQNKDSPRFWKKWATGGSFEEVAEQLEADEVSVTHYVGPCGSNVTAFNQRPLEELL